MEHLFRPHPCYPVSIAVPYHETIHDSLDLYRRVLLSGYDRLTGGFNCQLVKVNSRATSRQFISLLRNLEYMKLESSALQNHAPQCNFSVIL